MLGLSAAISLCASTTRTGVEGAVARWDAAGGSGGKSQMLNPDGRGGRGVGPFRRGLVRLPIGCFFFSA
jgi:hypothetical protein